MAFLTMLQPFPACQVDDRADLPVAALEGVTTDGYPVEATMTEFMRWWTRVRRWRMSGSMNVSWIQTYEETWEESTGPWSMATVAEVEIDATTAGQYAQGEEDHLVTGHTLAGSTTGEITANVTDDYPGRAPGYTALAVWALNWELEDTPPRWRESEDGDRYFPRMTFSGSVVVGGLSGALRFSSTYQAEIPGERYTYGEISFAGKTVAVQFHWEDFAGTITTSTETIDITIAPYEFYEMDPGDGLGPVWNASTGERTERKMPNP